MKSTIDNRYCHRFNHLEIPILSLNLSDASKYLELLAEYQLVCVVAGYERRLVIMGHRPRELSCQNGVAATWKRNQKPIEIFPHHAHRCTYNIFYIIQNNWLSLNYNLVDLTPLKDLEASAREMVSLFTSHNTFQQILCMKAIHHQLFPHFD